MVDRSAPEPLERIVCINVQRWAYSCFLASYIADDKHRINDWVIKARRLVLSEMSLICLSKHWAVQCPSSVRQTRFNMIGQAYSRTLPTLTLFGSSVETVIRRRNIAHATAY